MKWFSFKNKQSRPIKVVVKKFHQSCQPQQIKEDLKNKMLKIPNVYQLLRRKDNRPLLLFALAFNKDEYVKTFFMGLMKYSI